MLPYVLMARGVVHSRGPICPTAEAPRDADDVEILTYTASRPLSSLPARLATALRSSASRLCVQGAVTRYVTHVRAAIKRLKQLDESGGVQRPERR